jgi:hypothetical protein
MAASIRCKPARGHTARRTPTGSSLESTGLGHQPYSSAYTYGGPSERKPMDNAKPRPCTPCQPHAGPPGLEGTRPFTATARSRGNSDCPGLSVTRLTALESDARKRNTHYRCETKDRSAHRRGASSRNLGCEKSAFRSRSVEPRVVDERFRATLSSPLGVAGARAIAHTLSAPNVRQVGRIDGGILHLTLALKGSNGGGFPDGGARSLVWLEHPADNRKVAGSNPAGPTSFQSDSPFSKRGLSLGRGHTQL